MPAKDSATDTSETNIRSLMREGDIFAINFRGYNKYTFTPVIAISATPGKRTVI
jgi:hypothetical protein